MRNRWNLLVGLLVCFLALNPSLASALSLCDVDGSSESYSAEGSNLVFSDFEVTVTGNKHFDIDLVEIEFEDDGLSLIGPMAAGKGKLLDIVLEYTVTSIDRIVGVELSFTGFASGKGSASVAETIEGFPTVALGVFDNRSGTLTSDFADLGDGANTLQITKDILLEGGGRKNGNGHGHGMGHRHFDGCGHHGSIAHISVIRQRFETEPGPIPEPSSFVLLGLGLGGLATLRRPRRS